METKIRKKKHSENKKFLSKCDINCNRREIVEYFHKEEKSIENDFSSIPTCHRGKRTFKNVV